MKSPKERRGGFSGPYRYDGPSPDEIRRHAAAIREASLLDARLTVKRARTGCKKRKWS